MAKTFITAHIKLEDEEWQALGRQAENHDFTTAQLVRKILRGWLWQQQIIDLHPDGPRRRQTAGDTGFDPSPRPEDVPAKVVYGDDPAYFGPSDDEVGI